MTGLVSVIIPCYKQAHFLPDALKSVLEQTYQNWECIIVNDGSPDNTEEVALAWCKKDSRFIYHKKENGGLSSARNAGLSIASGDYLQFLDSDDTLHPIKFEKQIACFSKDVDVVISDYLPFDNEYGTFLSRRYLNPFINESNYKYDIVLLWETHLSIPCHCILFKRTLMESPSYLTFDESLPNHEDWVFWTKLFYRSAGVFNLIIALANYRIHVSSMCHDEAVMNKGFLSAADRIIDYFNTINDKKGLETAILKKSFINPITGSRQKDFGRKMKERAVLFVPPAVFILTNKLKKYLAKNFV